MNRTINDALRQIGEVVGANRCFVYLLTEEGQTLFTTHEWCAAGHELPVDAVRQLPATRIPWWMEQLRHDRPIHLQRLADLPAEAEEERGILTGLGVKSCLVVPILSHTTLRGFLGFSAIHREQRWSEDIVRLLRIVGDIIINSLIRTRAELEIRQLNVDLRQRVNELNAANHELESFSYSVSHDLRSPLRGIEGFSHLLGEDCGHLLDAQGKEYISLIHTSCMRMEAIIDDLLNLAHVARREMQREHVDLSHIVQEVARELQKNNPGRQVEFIIPPRLTAFGDQRLLQLALENLLNNAWKFTGTRECARIEFATLEETERTVYCVRDNGVGFDPARADRLFRAFQRLHSGTQFPGTGIGLAIVQRIIDRHGGAVWAESESGKGATFFFTLPS